MTKTQQVWWLEQRDGDYFVKRVKNGIEILLKVDGILHLATDPKHVIRVKTIHLARGIICKPFNLKEFDWRKNLTSSRMSNFRESGDTFTQRWEALTQNQPEPSNGDPGRESPNIQTKDDICSDTSDLDNDISRKKVTFEMADTIEVPIAVLCAPPPQRAVRASNQPHVQELKSSFQRRQEKKVLTCLAVHIPNTLPSHVKKQDLLDGTFELEVIGGVHRWQAMMDLKLMVSVPVVVYAGLTDKQALAIGHEHEHNTVYLAHRAMSMQEYIYLFRKKLDENPDEGLSQNQRAKWRRDMATILGEEVKEVRKKYRHHTWLASQPSRIWSKVKEFLTLWERHEIKDQPSGHLKPSQVSFLGRMSAEETEQTLSKLNRLEMSFKETKPEEDSNIKKRREPSVEYDKRELRKLQKWEAELNDWEKRLVEREKRLAEMEERIKENEGTLIKPMVQAIDAEGKQHTKPHDESRMLKLLTGQNCVPGDWVAVRYTGIRVDMEQKSENDNNNNNGGNKLSELDSQSSGRSRRGRKRRAPPHFGDYT